MAYFPPRFFTPTLTLTKSLKPFAVLGGISIMGSLLVSGTLHRSQALPPEPTIQNFLAQGTVVDPEISFRQPDTREIGDPLDRPRGGGSRGCDDDPQACGSEALAALVPFDEHVFQDEQGQEKTVLQAWGQTLERHPTLWFYMPHSADVVYGAEFSLWTEAGDRLFHTTDVPLLAAPGIMGYTLSTPLNIDQTYRWRLYLQLDPDFPNIDEWVSGRIQRVRVAPEVQAQLDQASVPQQAEILAESGIWYDVLTTIAIAYPDNAPLWTDVWKTVLTDAGLASFADAPLGISNQKE
ncbi:MAG: DUF928 domain-containing protein [Cyanobacteria bacterium P01_F01_bin.150]